MNQYKCVWNTPTYMRYVVEDKIRIDMDDANKIALIIKVRILKARKSNSLILIFDYIGISNESPQTLEIL